MMNSAFGTLVSKIKYNQCVMVGHPLSGKKSLMQHYQLCPDEFSYYKSLKFNIWDLFNKEAPIMQYFFTNIKAVIFVFDVKNLNSDLLKLCQIMKNFKTLLFQFQQIKLIKQLNQF
ncbi:Gtr1/RagA_G protein [Hexamita inflata]|uniref:Gtr1/RagA G protein n=1 Tax=Hexamita inflata TaxID=28002 RepID=A0AA86TNN0_9EUKA|nr:Gtr1/RagA G protein [Hexamita inflata]